MTSYPRPGTVTPLTSIRRSVSGGGIVLAAALSLVLAGAAAAGCGASGTSAETSGIIALPTPDSPLVTLRIGFRTGSVDDPAGKDGLNALTAMMMGRGGTESLTFEEITETLYPWSASIRAQFDKEMTVLVGEVHRDHLEPFFAIVRDLVVAPRFDESDFARNRDFLTNTVVSTLRGSDDEELGKETLERPRCTAGHPYESPTVGTEEGLAALTLDDVRAFHHRDHYTRAPGRSSGWRAAIPTALSSGWSRRSSTACRPMDVERAPLPAPRALDGRELLLVD